ncbi:MAG: YdjY domain-containing protein [Phycisphaerales bacterium]
MPQPAPQRKLVELFPGVRADLAARVVEFDGIVPLDAHDPVTPIVYLEVLVCTPDTKEHEALVMTRAKPSHVHAALLAAGFIPGEPGRWDWDGTRLVPRAPKGDGLAVLFVRRGEDGREIEEPAETWVKRERDGKPLAGSDDGPRWRFAGSQMVKRGPGGPGGGAAEVYDADGAGTLIGLTTFGSETIAWHRTISPEATVEEPELIADAAKVPKMGTAVTVRIRGAR